MKYAESVLKRLKSGKFKSVLYMARDRFFRLTPSGDKYFNIFIWIPSMLDFTFSDNVSEETAIAKIESASSVWVEESK
jgi:hypothetical protein